MCCVLINFVDWLSALVVRLVLWKNAQDEFISRGECGHQRARQNESQKRSDTRNRIVGNCARSQTAMTKCNNI